MVVAGAAGDDRGVVGYNGTFMDMRLSGFHYGANGDGAREAPT
jgi:hypothetical protein